MTLIRSQVVYECRVQGIDLASGKHIGNTLYYRDTTSLGSYGNNIAGSSLESFEDSLYHKWFDTINPPMGLLNTNYQLISIRCRGIIGRLYPTTMVPITGVVAGLTETHVVTGGPHGLTTGDSAIISGVTTPVALNGTYTEVVVINANEFAVAGSIGGAYTGPGIVQLLYGNQQYQYGEMVEVLHSDLGGTVGHMIPIFAGVSMRRITASGGKNWRSRISLAPISEPQQVNGRLEVAALAAFVLCGAALTGSLLGGTATMRPVAVSKQLAFVTPTPWVESASWAKDVVTYAPRTDLGSMVSRKPRLTAAIV